MAENDPFLGEIVGGRYQVVARIGRGAMGAIYEVRHTKLKRSFALKRLMPHLADDKEALERFQQEADVVAGLRHPNVVEIVDWETLPDGTPCIVMELLRGENLEQRVGRVGKLAWPELFSIADQALSALAVAHRAGVVHRDLKPQNIFLTRDDSGDERLKLLDFGISKVQGSGHTSVGAVIGTPAYMAPEQADSRSDDIGPATDLWAMGVILYELATGTQPFQGASGSAVLYKVCYGAVEPLGQQRPDADPRFVQLVEQLMRKPIAERPSDADAVRRVLRSLSEDALPEERTSITEHTVTDARVLPTNTTTLSSSTGQSIELPVERPAPSGSRWPIAGGVVALVALALVALVVRPHAPPVGAQPAAEPVAPVVPSSTGVPVPVARALAPASPAPELPLPVPRPGKTTSIVVNDPDPAVRRTLETAKRPAKRPHVAPSGAKKPADVRPLEP